MHTVAKVVMYTMVLVVFSKRAIITFKKLQGHSVTVSMQKSQLESNKLYYMELVGPRAHSTKAVTRRMNLMLLMNGFYPDRESLLPAVVLLMNSLKTRALSFAS